VKVGRFSVGPVALKTFAGLIAGGVLILNAWLSGIFSGGRPFDLDDPLLYVAIYAQWLVLIIVIAQFDFLAVDIAGGVLAALISAVVYEFVNAFHGKFDAALFVGQLVFGFLAAFTSYVAGSYVLRPPGERTRPLVRCP
jgi:hypothetical protein